MSKAKAKISKERQEQRADFLEVMEQGDANLQRGDVVGVDVAVKQVSATSLVLDDWSKRQGAELYHASPAIREQFKDTDKTTRECEYATADLFAMAFDPAVTFAENPKDPARSAYMQSLANTVEFQELKASTTLDPVASEIASVSFARTYRKMIVEGKTSNAKEALDDAQKDVDDCRDMRECFGGDGIGGNGGNPKGKISAKETIEMLKRVRRSNILQRIAQLAGRYRRAAQSMQRSKVVQGVDEMLGVTMGSEIDKLVSGELARLCCGDADMEDLALMRVLQGGGLIREQKAVESVARGPIVVVVDESGSMSGEPICQAKAIALAMYWVAKHQKRYCCLVGFSGGTDGTYLPIAPGENKDKDVFKWCEHFFGGGTDCDVPLVTLPKKWDKLGCPKGKTDMLIITDAQVHCPPPVMKDFNQWRENERCRVTSLIIGQGYKRNATDTEAGDLARVSDVVHMVKNLELGQAGGEIEETFASV